VLLGDGLQKSASGSRTLTSGLQEAAAPHAGDDCIALAEQEPAAAMSAVVHGNAVTSATRVDRGCRSPIAEQKRFPVSGASSEVSAGRSDLRQQLPQALLRRGSLGVTRPRPGSLSL
jgi:hypothetical protein